MTISGTAIIHSPLLVRFRGFGIKEAIRLICTQARDPQFQLLVDIASVVPD